MPISAINATQPVLVEAPTTVDTSAAGQNPVQGLQNNPNRHQPAGAEQVVAYVAGQAAYVAGIRLGIPQKYLSEVPALAQGLTRFARTGDPAQIAVGYLHSKITAYAWGLTQLAYHAAGAVFERTPAAAGAAAMAGAAALSSPVVRERMAEYVSGALPTSYA